jgi:hypothetical protein
MGLDENDFYKHLNQMINNTYDILTRKKEIYEIIEDDSVVSVFLFDPSEGYPEYNEDIYLLLIDYYEEYEEYEKCQELLYTMEIHKSIS